MGLFSKKKAEPVVHPEVKRCIWLRASPDDVIGHLTEYSGLQSPKHADEHQVMVTAAGGWVTVDLPAHLHPWAFHNLAFWLLDTPGGDDLVAASGAAPTHPGYRLVRDPEIADSLCGVDDVGNGWTVLVPTNDIVRGEAVPAEATQTQPTASGGSIPVALLIEDPGRHMNPANQATEPNRKRLSVDHTQVMF